MKDEGGRRNGGSSMINMKAKGRPSLGTQMGRQNQRGRWKSFCQDRWNPFCLDEEMIAKKTTVYEEILSYPREKEEGLYDTFRESLRCITAFKLKELLISCKNTG